MKQSLLGRGLASIALVAIVAGCSSASTTAPSTAASAAAPSTAASAAAPSTAASAAGATFPTPSKPITIGFAVPALANSYWKANADFAAAIGAQMGVKVVAVDDGEKQDVQYKNVQDMIAAGDAGIIFGPDTVEIGPRILDLCKNAKIVCATAARKPGVEPSADTASYYAGYVVGDDAADGAAGADALAAAGAKNVVGMSGLQGNSVADARIAGFLKEAQAKGLNVLATQRPVELPEAGQTATQNFLARFPGPGFDGLWSFNDSSAIGAVAALTAANAVDKVKIAAIDGSSDGIAMIQKGQMVLSAGGGEWVNGGFALILIYDTIMGHPWGTGVVIPGVQVTKDNAAAYKSQYVDQLPTYDATQLSKVTNPSASADTFKVVLH